MHLLLGLDKPGQKCNSKLDMLLSPVVKLHGETLHRTSPRRVLCTLLVTSNPFPVSHTPEQQSALVIKVNAFTNLIVALQPRVGKVIYAVLQQSHPIQHVGSCLNLVGLSIWGVEAHVAAVSLRFADVVAVGHKQHMHARSSKLRSNNEEVSSTSLLGQRGTHVGVRHQLRWRVNICLLGASTCIDRTPGESAMV